MKDTHESKWHEIRFYTDRVDELSKCIYEESTKTGARIVEYAVFDKTPTPSVESWEDDFFSRFTNAQWLEHFADDIQWTTSDKPTDVAVFIRSLIASTEDSRNPMGVSQWREHGKRYGYWDFFERRVREETLDAVERRGDWLSSLGSDHCVLRASDIRSLRQPPAETQPTTTEQ